MAKQEPGDPAAADAAAVPQPRQPRDVGRAARPLALASKAEEAGVYILPETAGLQAARRGRPGASASAPATRAAAATASRSSQLRARLGRDRQGHGARRGHAGPPRPARRSATSTSAPGDPQQWELGVKEVWEVQKPLDRVIHTMGWPLRAAAPSTASSAARSSTRWARTRCRSASWSGSTTATRRFSCPRRAPGAEAHPKLVRGILEGGKRVGWGAKTIPSGGYWAMPDQLWAPGHVHRRRRRRHGQRAEAQGHPPTRCTPACSRPRRSSSGLKKGSHRRPLRATRSSSRTPRSRRTCTARATCASRSPRASSWAARWPT